jgi:hypothetical protein
MIATSGSRRVLLPHPAADRSRTVLLVEGEPDMIAARSRRLPAIGVPGVDAWRTEWAQFFADRDVTTVTHADPQGRRLAQRIADDLSGIAEVNVVDIAPERNDGYDLTDWLRAHCRSFVTELRAGRAAAEPAQPVSNGV